MNRNDLQHLAQLRLNEASALSASGWPAGAYYLAGYSIECALKACIARGVQQYDFPDRSRVNQSYTHDFAQLLSIAGLDDTLGRDIHHDANLALNWYTVKDWRQDRRYDVTIARGAAERMSNAVSDATSGVLPWITQHW